MMMMSGNVCEVVMVVVIPQNRLLDYVRRGICFLEEKIQESVKRTFYLTLQFYGGWQF